jgi:hypothetical protein
VQARRVLEHPRLLTCLLPRSKRRSGVGSLIRRVRTVDLNGDVLFPFRRAAI